MDSRIENPFVLGLQIVTFFIITGLAIFVFSHPVMRTVLVILVIYLAYKFLG